jgi:transcriptional regulator with XRE-family HTH domain
MRRSRERNISQNIVQFRKKAGMSQEQVAEQLGLNRVSYLQLEKGNRKLMAEELIDLSELFQVSPEVILGLRKEPEVRLKAKPKAAKSEAGLRISVPSKNVAKFRQVLLHLLGKIGSQPNVGKSVINKLFYFIDFDYYEKFEEQLTGAVYIRNHFGPTPVAFPEIVELMERQGEIKKEMIDYHGKRQEKYIPLKEAELSILNGRELQHVDSVIERLKHMSAAQIQEYSHGDIPWKTTPEGKPIDYEAVFYRQAPYSVRAYDDDSEA